MTTITDIIIAIFALYYSRELTALYFHQFLNVQYHWIWTFRMLSLGALLGAISHGIGPYFHPVVGDLIWKFTTYCIGIMSYFMVLTMLHHLFDYPIVLRLRWILIELIVIYLTSVTINENFINFVKELSELNNYYDSNLEKLKKSKMKNSKPFSKICFDKKNIIRFFKSSTPDRGESL